MNQLEVRRGLANVSIATPQTQEKWVDENVESGAKRRPKPSSSRSMTAPTPTPVGTAGLFHIAHAHGTAEFAIALGERRGQGLGTEATRLVLDFAFHVLQLRNVLLETLEWNVAGLAAYEHAGFRRIGVRRGAIISRGQPTNIVIMDASRRTSEPLCCAEQPGAKVRDLERESGARRHRGVGEDRRVPNPRRCVKANRADGTSIGNAEPLLREASEHTTPDRRLRRVPAYSSCTTTYSPHHHRFRPSGAHRPRDWFGDDPQVRLHAARRPG